MTPDALAYALSPEWFHAFATGLPLLALALWVPVGLGAAWRRTLWRARGAEVRALVGDGHLIATRWGFTVTRGGLALAWTGGMTPRTVLTRGRVVLERRDGWADAEEAGAWLARHAG